MLILVSKLNVNVLFSDIDNRSMLLNLSEGDKVNGVWPERSAWTVVFSHDTACYIFITMKQWNEKFGGRTQLFVQDVTISCTPCDEQLINWESNEL